MEKIKQTTAITLLFFLISLAVRFDMNNRKEAKIYSLPSESVSGEVKFFWSNVKIDSLVIHKAHPIPEKITILKEKRSWFTFYRPGMYMCCWYVKGRKMPIVSYFRVLKNRPKHVSRAFFI